MKSIAHRNAILALVVLLAVSSVYAGAHGSDSLREPLSLAALLGIVVGAIGLILLPLPQDHVHSWAVAKSTYRPPTESARRKKGVADRAMREAVYGVTTTSLRCRTCKDHRTVESIGDARLPVEIPEDLL